MGLMLNGGDGYQSGGNADDEASEGLKDAEALFGRLKRQVKADYNSKGQVNWRREAREDFDFEAGEQLDEDDKAILMDAKRPIVIFNRGRQRGRSGSRQPAGSAVLAAPARRGEEKTNF